MFCAGLFSMPISLAFSTAKALWTCTGSAPRGRNQHGTEEQGESPGCASAPSAPPAHPKQHSVQYGLAPYFSSTRFSSVYPVSQVDIDITKCNYSSATHKPKTKIRFSSSQLLFAGRANAREDWAASGLRSLTVHKRAEEYRCNICFSQLYG